MQSLTADWNSRKKKKEGISKQETQNMAWQIFQININLFAYNKNDLLKKKKKRKEKKAFTTSY